MVPEILKLQGFLSYKNAEELDFRKFHVALISGENGQGKSSLLDAMTFALFGMARGVSGGGRGVEDLVSNGEDFLKVELVFLQHGKRYRIVRTYDKQKRSASVRLDIEKDGEFTNISEGRKRETESLIKKIIGMDYEAFVTSSFIMQGKADFFTVKSETEKIEILRQILGLEIYEQAREITLSKINVVKKEKEVMENRISKIESELSGKNEAENLLKEMIRKEKEVSDREKIVESEEKRIEEKFSEYKLKKQKLESLKNEFAKLKENKEKETEKLNLLKGKLRSYEETVKKKEEILSGYDKFNKNEEEISKLYEKKNATEKLFREKEKKESVIEREIRILTERKKNLAKVIAESEKAIKEKTELANTLKEEIGKMQKELAALEKKLSEKLGLLSEEKKALEKENRKLTEKRKILAEIEKLNALKKEREETLKKVLDESNKEILRLEREKRKLTGFIKTSSSDIASEIEDLKNRHIELQRQIEELSNERTKLIKEKGILENKLAETIEKERLLEKDVKNCPLCGAPLTPEHAKEIRLKYVNDAEQTERKIAETKIRISEISKEIDDKKKEVKELLNTVSEKEKEKEFVIKYEERVDGANTHIKDLLEKKGKAEEALSHGVLSEEENKNLALLKQRLEKLGEVGENSVYELEEKVSVLEGERDTLQKNVSLLKAGIGQKVVALNGAKDIVKSEEEKKENAKSELENVESMLASPDFMQSEKNAIKSFKEEIEKIGFREEMLENKLNERKSLVKFKSLYEKLREAETHISEIKERIKECEASISETEKEMENKKVQMESVFEEVKKLEGSEGLLKEKRGELRNLREEIKRIAAERARAEAQVKVLEKSEAELKTLKKQLEDTEENLKVLEVCKEMFGKSGIQIEIIRDAVPVIENIANEMLSDMTNGRMSLKFDTVRTLKTRKEVRDTFEIHVYDNGNRRRYALFSGGEQFRINLAIRVAISRFLSDMAGAPLEMLVIDEGFGSQDEYGRAKIIEEINSFKDRFKKIIIITHVSEIKESFVTYTIRVEKDDTGSHIYVA